MQKSVLALRIRCNHIQRMCKLSMMCIGCFQLFSSLIQQYIPSKGDIVVGTVVGKYGEYYKVSQRNKLSRFLDLPQLAPIFRFP